MNAKQAKTKTITEKLEKINQKVMDAEKELANAQWEVAAEKELSQTDPEIEKLYQEYHESNISE